MQKLFIGVFLIYTLLNCKSNSHQNHSEKTENTQNSSKDNPQSTLFSNEFKEYKDMYELFEYVGRDANIETIKRIDENSTYRFLYSPSDHSQEEIELKIIKTIEPEMTYEVQVPSSNEVYQLETCLPCEEITLKNDKTTQKFKKAMALMGNRGIYRCKNTNGEKEYLKIYGFLKELRAFYCTEKNPDWVELKVSNVHGAEMDEINFFDVDFPDGKPYKNFRVEATKTGYSVGYDCGGGGACAKIFDWIGK